jgi:hypothetical protein
MLRPHSKFERDGEPVNGLNVALTLLGASSPPVDGSGLLTPPPWLQAATVIAAANKMPNVRYRLCMVMTSNVHQVLHCLLEFS